MDREKYQGKGYRGFVLPGFFALCMLLGNSYYQTNSWELCFGSVENILKFILMFLVLYIIFFLILKVVWAGLTRCSGLKQQPESRLGRLCSKGLFPKAGLAILVLWSPFVLLCYPGGYCVDVCYQISQVLGQAAYSTQQPLLHTLLVGGFVKYGELLTGSYNKGLYLYILVQTLILAAALAFSLVVLYKRGVSEKIILVCLGIYGLVPMFSNFATMAIKDTLFNAFIVVYIAALTLLETGWTRQQPAQEQKGVETAEAAQEQGQKGLGLELLAGAAALLVMLFRNNGLYIVVFTGAVLGICLWKNMRIRFAQKLRLLGNVLVLPVLLYFLISGCLSSALQAENVGSREMLSVLMQQTARYARDYGEDVTQEERAAIEAVFGDYDSLVQLYDPDIADPVKNRFDAAATGEELGAYLKAWGAQLLRHPDAYIQAFFNSVYGWFYPGVSNSLRYEGSGFLFWRPELMQKVENHLNDYYAVWDSIPILGLLENAGFYTWSFLVLLGWMWKRGNKRQLYLLAPAAISLLICLASPAFFLHIRYAFPIMFPLPFLFGIVVNGKADLSHRE